MGYAERLNDAARRAAGATAAARDAEAARARTQLVGLKVAVDVQHFYRGGRHAGDRGALFELGARRLFEADAASLYALALVGWLRWRGAAVLTNDPARALLIGDYPSRNRAAMAWGAAAYLACHLNAGGGSYALIEYVKGRGDGGALAPYLTNELDRSFPPITVGRVVALEERERGAVCIRAVTTAAALCEPLFGDQPQHHRLLDLPGLKAVGEALGRGLRAWWRARVPIP